MNITKEEILKALSYVDDPDLKKDLVTLNMIQNIEIEGKTIRFDLVLTTPACPLKDSIANACKTAVITMVDKDADVQINITSNVQRSRENNTVLGSVKNIIAVASGKGGVGKSTVAINLAKTLQKAGAKVGILDADIHGPSIPVLLNVDSEKPQMNGNLMVPIQSDGVKTMSIGYLVEKKQALVWRGPMLSKAISQFCTDVDWGDLDYLFIDLPPGTGDVHLSIIQQIPLSGVIIVTTPEDVAVSDTRKAIDMFTNPQLKQNILGVVENMSFFEPEVGKKYYIFGKEGGAKLSKEWDVDLLGELPILEDKSFSNQHKNYLPIVGQIVQKLSVLAANT
ncbi:MAG: Mrp/NBP35 family ATP-binding protein [Bacteroidia bacterium]|nr:Mrp/NBP35 family ATP-binding protein [Bacteroidia bacterium]NNJ55763.1 Mrp/NBP35 family ATP-binding protein [Bacteroidia bacterium]